MKKILVTGGNGFLGSYVVRELLKYKNNEITILSNKKQKIQSNTKLILVDITDKKAILRKVKNFDSIYHLAGNIRTPQTDTKVLHFALNAGGTKNLLEACRINNIHRFIFISTSEVYGDKSKGQIKENERKNPSNDYGKSKLLAEKYCKEYAYKYNIIVTVIRPSYIYGYGQYGGRLFPKLIESVLKTKKIKLRPSSGGSDFVYVKDVAAGIVMLGERKQRKKFEDYNLSSGRFTTIKEIFRTMRQLTHCNYEEAKEINRKVKKFSLRIKKAKKIGYNPKFSLRGGLADYIKSYTNGNK